MTARRPPEGDATEHNHEPDPALRRTGRFGDRDGRSTHGALSAADLTSANLFGATLPGYSGVSGEGHIIWVSATCPDGSEAGRVACVL
jgi:hypothetical protein